MSKEQFLRTLHSLLKDLPEDELERIIGYYREMIEDKVENGQTEQQAVAELGDIRVLAQKILAENPNRRPKNTGKIAAICIASILGVVFILSIVLAAFRNFHVVASIPANMQPDAAATDSSAWSASADDDQPSTHFAQNGQYKTYQVNGSGISNIELDVKEKAIVIEPGNDSQITVAYIPGGSHDYQFSCGGGTLKIQNEIGIKNPFRFSRDDETKPDIFIRIPSPYRGSIHANTTNSYILAKNLKKLNTLHLKTNDSYIKLSSLAAQTVEIDTQNAAINLDAVSASSHLTATTRNAVIRLTDTESPDTLLQTENAMIIGTIHGDEEDYTVDAETTNAISNLPNRTGGSKKLTVKTTNAIINVKFED